VVKALAKSAERFLSYDEFIMALTAARSQLLVMQNQSPQAQSPKVSPVGGSGHKRRRCARLEDSIAFLTNASRSAIP